MQRVKVDEAKSETTGFFNGSSTNVEAHFKASAVPGGQPNIALWVSLNTVLVA
jgi:hypothetical protein